MREVTTVATNFNLEQHCYLEEQLYKRWPSATSVRLSLATHMTFYANSLKFVTSRISTLWTSRSFSLFPFSLISIVSRQFKIVARNYWMIHAATFNQYVKCKRIFIITMIRVICDLTLLQYRQKPSMLTYLEIYKVKSFKTRMHGAVFYVSISCPN